MKRARFIIHLSIVPPTHFYFILAQAIRPELCTNAFAQKVYNRLNCCQTISGTCAMCVPNIGQK